MPSIHRLQVDGAIIEYTLRRSRRRKKTVEISVSRGSVEVSAPWRTPNREIQSIVRKRSNWILERLANPPDVAPPLVLASGQRVPYLGKELTLEVAESSVRKASASLEGENLRLVAPTGLDESARDEALLAALKAWYREQARQLLADSVARWLPVMGRTEMPRVLVREQRTRWGSCSADGTLRFSWRLALVEPGLIDSVAVHELAHLDVMNHSQDFWNVVLRAMPDARERRKRLNHVGRFIPL